MPHHPHARWGELEAALVAIDELADALSCISDLNLLDGRAEVTSAFTRHHRLAALFGVLGDALRLREQAASAALAQLSASRPGAPAPQENLPC